jgi:hypothetical protein
MTPREGSPLLYREPDPDADGEPIRMAGPRAPHDGHYTLRRRIRLVA